MITLQTCNILVTNLLRPQQKEKVEHFTPPLQVFGLTTSALRLYYDRHPFLIRSSHTENI